MQTKWWMHQFPPNTVTQRESFFFSCHPKHLFFHFFLPSNSLISNSFTSVLPLSIFSISIHCCIDLTSKSHWFNSNPLSAVKFTLKLRFPSTTHRPSHPWTTVLSILWASFMFPQSALSFTDLNSAVLSHKKKKNCHKMKCHGRSYEK